MSLFIHSFIPAFSIAPLQHSTIQRRSRLQHGYCIGVSRQSAQTTAGKGLAQGPYVAARAGVEPTTLRLKVIASTKAPPRPHYGSVCETLWTLCVCLCVCVCVCVCVSGCVCGCVCAFEVYICIHTSQIENQCFGTE